MGYLCGASWIPDNVSITMCSVPPVGQKHAGVCLSNSVRLCHSLPCVFALHPFSDFQTRFGRAWHRHRSKRCGNAR